MDEILQKVDQILIQLREQILLFINHGDFDNAKLLLDQYIKLSPTGVERYTLDAIIRSSMEDLDGAKDILLEGIRSQPLSFDLFYNLGYIYNEMGEYLDSYNAYMRARYLAKSEEEKEDISSAFRGIRGNTSYNAQSKGDMITMSLKAGKTIISTRMRISDMLKHKMILEDISNRLDRNNRKVLEVSFFDGIISKNLNLFGYDVTAVDKNKDSLLRVIVLENHENTLYHNQKVAKFYIDNINMDWVNSISEYDGIIAVYKNNLDNFSINKESKDELLNSLIKKVKGQLFIRASIVPSEKDFTKEDIEKLATSNNLTLKVIHSDKDEDGLAYEICLLEKRPIENRFSIPVGLQSMDSDSTILRVSIDKCRDLFGTAYRNDWHYFVETLLQYEKNSELKYEDSILKEYYQGFNPKNLEEGLFTDRGQAPKLSQGWIEYPWNYDKSKRLIFTQSLGETRPGGNHFFGPNSDEFGSAEFSRLTKLYTMLKKHGYQPELHPDGYITGYLLARWSDYRFVITEGQHRMACLAALGYDEINCRFTENPRFLRKVSFDEIKKWPQVNNGVYSRNLARKVFNRFFEDGVGESRKRLIYGS